jgi:amino acid adenylation domain-containing protein
MAEQTIRGYHLSRQQKRIWPLLQHGTPFAVQTAVLLTGRLDRERLRQSIARMVGRHEVLRSTFQQPSGLKLPIQVVGEETEPVWREVEVAVEDAALPDVVESLLRREREEPLRLTDRGSLHFTLGAIDESHHVLAITASPLVADLESLYLVAQGAMRIYAAGGRDAGDDEPLQYAAFAAWQAEILDGDEATLGRKYWRSQDVATLLGVEHPLVRHLADPGDMRVERVERAIDPAVVSAIDDLARRTTRTDEQLYLACWCALLGRLTGSADVPVACRINGRTDEELETAVGPFAGFVPLRYQGEGRASFQAIVDHVVDSRTRARDWEPYFDWESATADSVGAESLFLSFAFEYRDVPAATEASGVRVSPLRDFEYLDRFHLKLSCSRRGDSVVVQLHYVAAALSREHAQRLIDQLEAALRHVVRNPSASFAEIDILGQEEWARTIEDFNATSVEYSEEPCIHDLFEAQVARCPDRCAVVYEGGILTYRALDDRANALAARLRAVGVGAGATVGIRVERSADIIVAILGILKAGGAYVPLDRSLPQVRLETLVRESRATAVVAHRALAGAFQEIDVEVIVLDDLLQSSGNVSGPNGVTVTPADLAYVLFTSGTTGVPKGVGVEHRQIANYTRGVVERLGVSDGEHMATVSTFAADLGNTVVYAALTSGGTLHVVSEHRRSNPNALAQYFARWPIDCLKVVPSHLEALLSASTPQDVLSCRRIVLGGEATPWTLVDRIEALSSTQLFNHYGPTETTVGATTCRLSRGHRDADSGTLPIGRPLPNYRAYILGSGGRPAPIGVIGELHIGGHGIARGYLNRPAETAERFVPDPFGGGGQRLYRTGDRTRHLPGGDIEFRGRVDDQIKIRGYRVEQAEVEAVVASCPAVRQAVVVARREGDETRLVAYVVLRPEEATVGDVTTFTEQRLPDYMVPSVFVTLPSLPLNRNGKVDRQALPAPDASTTRESAVAPRTAIEQRLADIWRNLLRVDAIGVRDSFFDRGGHSLSAMQLVSRIRQQFDVELPLLSIFESPTIEGIAARIEEASGHPSKASLPPIVAARRDSVIPASFSQERLWLFDQLQPGNSAYNVPAAVQIGGALDVAALEQTIAAVVGRHEVLRTTFSSIDGRPVQVIAPISPARLSFIDLRAMTPRERTRHVEALVRAHAQRPFDLAKGPVWRATLLRLAADEHVVLWNQHHISSDGWSAGILARELSELYAAFAGGKPHGLTPLSIQYADFSQWQRDWLDGEGKAAQSAYWKQRLADAPPALALPTDRPHPPVQSFKGGSESVVLTPELSRALVALARQEGATTYITLLSSLTALLHLYTGQTDIIVGSPTAGRSHGQSEDLIGFFLNTLALRTKVKGDASVRELLRDVRACVLEAFANQDLPFEHIVDALQIERDRSRSVLYQVLFNHQRTSDARLAFGDLRLAPVESPGVGSKFDLTLYATEGPEQTALRMVYNADVFDRATISAMLERFVVLLEAVAANPDRQVSGLPLLTDDQRVARRVPDALSAGRPSAVGFDRSDVESTITERFERQVEAHPERIAVKTRQHEWTYRELFARATAVAGQIHAIGGASDNHVGLLFEKGAPLIAGILGTLQSGRAYVPLDPSNPRDRLSYMLKHSEAGILLADNANLTFARELAGDSVAVVGIEDAGPSDDRRIPVRPASPDSIAYILYTSGSTGVPKGVVQSHRNVLHFMQVYTNNLGISSSDRLSLLSSYGFDGAVMDIFGALLNGATLVPARLLEDGPEGVLRQMIDERVTVFHSTPTVFRQVFGDGSDSGEYPHVRLVVLGGEEALTADHELFKRRFGPTTVLVNGLGPSESTVTLQHFMTRNTVNRRRSLPVGLPVEDTEVLLLSAGGTPTDVYGEIAIRSRHVAFGYWRDPDKTQAAFTTEPDENGRRIYRTGDIGRRLPDGTLEFVGRKDSQVKIRGFRIELGEVESVLGGHSAVQECAVLARADKDGAARLVAYVRPSTSKADVASDLRSFLKQKLPEYMVPAAFVIQSSLPVTANGKLDRDALPNIDVKPEAGVQFIAPRTPVERRMAELWREVLGIERVGALDDFFAVGGQSLLAMRLISRIRSSFEIELALRLLFESPTLEGMAHHVEAALSSDTGHQRRLPPIESAPRDGRLPLSFAQQRMWILDQLEPGGATYNVPAAVELDGPLHPGALEQAVDAIVLRHEVLRTTFRKSDEGEPVQVIGEPGRPGMPVIDLTGLSSQHVEHTLDRLARHEARYPFDLTAGPLLRVATLRVTDQRHVVLFTMHHIVSDAWSTGVLVRELSELYQSLVAGRESALPPLPIQYADYAAWQRRWLESDSVQEQLQYWKRQLTGIPEQLALPLDRPRGADVTYNGAREAFGIEGDLVGSLASLGRDEGTTLFVSLLAVFQMLLHRYTGQRDIVTGAPIAGRNTAETEPLIGFFINTLVLRSRIDPMRTFRDLLREVHETVLNATANQDLPFERLVDELNPARGAGVTPLFQVAFVLQNAPRETLTMSDLVLRNRPVETRTSKFDWTVSLIEVAEGIAGHIEYNTDLFDGATLRRVAHDYKNLIKECVTHPDRVIADLEVLDGPGRQRVLVEWNDPTVEYPGSTCLHQWFDEQVERAPDRVAVILDGHQVTYRALSARANQLAHHLRSLGVGPEAPVGLYLERSIEMVVGILGVLKAGGAYVPLDPAHPPERLAFMVADAGLDVLVTEDRLAGGLPETRAHVLNLDRAGQAIARERSSVPAVEMTADNVAYVIYTSGSTGTPKGTPVTHRNVVRLFAATDDWFAFGEGDVWTLFHSYAFDFSVWELWGALCHGGRLVIVPYAVSRMPENFVELLARERVTVLNQTPSAFRQLVTAEGKHRRDGSMSALRYVVFGGEALEVRYLAPWINRHGSEQPRLINMYGITETTVHVTYRPITPADLETPRVDSPVGRPIRDLQLYVRDAHGTLSPTGVAGELFVGGAGVARGYHGRPALTAERFVPSPYVEGARLYRTGDGVRYLADGQLGFLGRIDQQVKIRGFRIELGEIEAALAAQDGVRDVIVLAREDVPGDQRLVAYLVVDPLRNPSTSDLRSALRRRLPDYMVPSAFVPLDALPLTPNGKVDRRALPEPGQAWGGTRPLVPASDAASRPSTDTEVAVARIWKSVLRTDNVDVDDKFFDLGGHSLNAIQVLTKIEQELGCQVKFNDLIFQTLRQVAASCEKQLADQAG